MEIKTLTLKEVVDDIVSFSPDTRLMSNIWYLTRDNRHGELQTIYNYVESRLPRYGFSQERATRVSIGTLELVQNAQLGATGPLARYGDVCFCFWMGEGYVFMATKNKGSLNVQKVLSSSSGLDRIGQERGRRNRGVHIMKQVFHGLEFDTYDGYVEAKAVALSTDPGMS